MTTIPITAEFYYSSFKMQKYSCVVPKDGIDFLPVRSIIILGLVARCYILAKCIAIFARNLVQTIMETIDFIDEIKTQANFVYL